MNHEHVQETERKGLNKLFSVQLPMNEMSWIKVKYNIIKVKFFVKTIPVPVIPAKCL